jgi:hypothetical protein
MSEYLEIGAQIARIVMMFCSILTLYFAQKSWDEDKKTDAFWILGISIWLMTAAR